MPFPFYPIGALVAAVILGSALTLFAVALRAIDRTVTRVGGSVLSGLVSGINGWSETRRAGPPQASPGTADRVEPASAVAVEHVQRD
jgi:hypothetical protein